MGFFFKNPRVNLKDTLKFEVYDDLKSSEKITFLYLLE